MGRKRKPGRPKGSKNKRKRKRVVKKKRFVRVSVIDGRLKRRKRKRTRRKLPPRVKTGKNKGRFRKRK